MKQDFITVTIKGMALDQNTQLPLILLSDVEESFLLPLMIGPAEASAVIVHLEGIHPGRPYTHDLFLHFFQKHQFRIHSMEIYSYKNSRYQARMRYSRGLRKFSMEIRPSDGIALALRAQASILFKKTLTDTIPQGTVLFETAGLMDTGCLYLEKDASQRRFM